MSPQVAVSKKLSESTLAVGSPTSTRPTPAGTGNMLVVVLSAEPTTLALKSVSVKRHTTAPVHASTIQTARPRLRVGSYPPLIMTTHFSIQPFPWESRSAEVGTRRTGPMGGGRGEKSLQDWAMY